MNTIEEKKSNFTTFKKIRKFLKTHNLDVIQSIYIFNIVEFERFDFPSKYHFWIEKMFFRKHFPKKFPNFRPLWIAAS